MAHFAEIGLNNQVIRVIVVNNSELLDENGVEQEHLGVQFCRSILGGTWLQTSYNNNFRKNFAGIGFTYDSQYDAFIPPKPYDSWKLNELTCLWQAPVPYPTDSKHYSWNEELLNWVEIP